jgi:hypothetical protein
MRSRIALTGPFKGLILLATMTDLVLTFYHMATASVRRELDVAFFISASF